MKINIEDLQDQTKMKFLMKIKNEFDGLELQHSRIYAPSSNYALHDAGYYMIFLRRLYRQIEGTAKYDSRIANLKSKNKDLFWKIKMREDFEHDVERDAQLDKEILVNQGIISEESSGTVRIHTSLIRKGDSILIVSGDQYWDLKQDHQAFCNTIEKYVELYPFHSAEDSQSEKKKHLEHRPKC